MVGREILRIAKGWYGCCCLFLDGSWFV